MRYTRRDHGSPGIRIRQHQGVTPLYVVDPSKERFITAGDSVSNWLDVLRLEWQWPLGLTTSCELKNRPITQFRRSILLSGGKEFSLAGFGLGQREPILGSLSRFRQRGIVLQGFVRTIVPLDRVLDHLPTNFRLIA
jgi:hypothetical protein